MSLEDEQGAEEPAVESIDVFEVLVREHSQMLSVFLRASLGGGDPAAVDDLWQETMITAWRRWDDYDRTRPFGAWLRGIAARNVLAWRRMANRRERVCDAATLEYYADMLGRLQSLQGDTFDEKLEALRQCIQALPDSYAASIRLRYEHGLKPAQMAERQKVKLETLKKQLLRAKQLLLECVTRKVQLAGGAES